MTDQPRILLIPGSLRTGSYNRALADLAHRRLEEAGGEVDHISLRDFPLAIYDGDDEAENGVPEMALTLHARFRAAQGVFIVSPEYNAGTPPLLKNAIDWVSRVRDHGGMASAFGRPVFALGSASPGQLGGYRGLMALRQSLVLQLKATVLPDMVSVAAAHQAFEDNGSLRDERTAGFLAKVAKGLVEAARGVTPYQG